MEFEGFKIWEEVPGTVKNAVGAFCARMSAEAMYEKALKDAVAFAQIAHHDQQVRLMASEAGSSGNELEELRAAMKEMGGDGFHAMFFMGGNVELMVATAFDAARVVLNGGDPTPWCNLDEEYRAIVGNRLGEESMRFAGLLARSQAMDTAKEVAMGIFAKIGEKLSPGLARGMAGSMVAMTNGTEHVDHMTLSALEAAVNHLLSLAQKPDPEAS